MTPNPATMIAKLIEFMDRVPTRQEGDFVLYLEEWMSQDRQLSKKQIQVLARIYAKVYDD